MCESLTEPPWEPRPSCISVVDSERVADISVSTIEAVVSSDGAIDGRRSSAAELIEALSLALFGERERAASAEGCCGGCDCCCCCGGAGGAAEESTMCGTSATCADR